MEAVADDRFGAKLVRRALGADIGMR